MALVFRRFPSDGVIAIFHEASGGGDKEDINSQRNRPAKSPADWLPNILFHSDLNYLEVAATGSVTRSQSSAAAATGPSSPSGVTVGVDNPYGWGVSREDFAVCTHDLGYPPYAAVIADGKVLHPGMPVQVGSAGAARFATVYCTTTEVCVETWCSVGGSSLSGTSITYDAIVLRDPRAKSGSKLWTVDDATGIVKMGLDKFANDRKFLQAVDGGSPFGIIEDRAGDLDNGAARFFSGDGTTRDTVPSNSRMRYGGTGIPVDWGDGMHYGGSLTAPSTFNVQVPDDPPGGDSGYRFDPDAELLSFFYNGRTTFTTSGKLIGCLDEETITGQAINFPSFSLATNYYHNYFNRQLDTDPFGDYNWEREGRAWLVAEPAETASTTNLMAVPSGVDFVIGLAKLTRTNAPADWFDSDPINVQLKTGVWIPFMGSFTALLEAGLGFGRMISVYVDGGQLKLWQKQSVGTEPGGYGTYDNSRVEGGDQITDVIQVYDNGGNPGIPVRMTWDSNTSKFSSGGPTPAASVPANDRHRWDGSQPPSPPTSPDLASAYSLDLKFAFGRRS